jgi:hypothetical protein
MQESLERNMMFLKDTELQNYIEYRTNFEPEEVLAAVKEYQRRGRVFTNEELASIKKDLKKLTPEQIEAKKKVFTGMAGWKQNIIRDPQVDAPILYPRFAVYLFSVLFTVLFGSIMLAMNIKRTEQKRGAGLVITSGGFVTLIELLIACYFPTASVLSIIINFGYSLYTGFGLWNEHIGNDTRYKARSLGGPLLMGLLVYAIGGTFLYLIILYTRMHQFSCW